MLWLQACNGMKCTVVRVTCFNHGGCHLPGEGVGSTGVSEEVEVGASGSGGGASGSGAAYGVEHKTLIFKHTHARTH